MEGTKVKSFFRQIFLANSLANLATLFIGLLIIIFVFLQLSRFKGWGIAIDNAGRLRFNSQWAKSSAYIYYQKNCINKENAQDYLDRIEKSQKIVFKSIDELKFGKNGSKAISSVRNPDAKRLFNEIEEGYKEFFSLIDNLTKSCDANLIPKIDEVSEKILANAMELTSFLANEDNKDMNIMVVVIPLLILLILVLSFVSFIISRRTIRSSLDEFFNKVILSLKNLENGNFTFKLTEEWGEFQPIAVSINTVKRVVEGLLNGILIGNKAINEVIKQEKETIQEIAPITAQIQSLVERAKTVASELKELLSFIESSNEGMKLAISEISKNTHETADRAKLVRSAATEMEQTVLNLSRSMEKIRDITEIIRDIADRTNLLALNASIEAARAGESGKGFAVVANEVKVLAKKVAEFIGEIDKIIERLFQEVKMVIEKTERTKRLIDEVENATSTIAGAVEEQSTVTRSIVENTTQTREKSLDLIAEIEELAKVADKLTHISKDLNINSDILSEISSTNQIAANLFETSKEALSDEDLQKFSIQALVNLGILGHINWKARFLDDANKGIIPGVERSPKRCLLGRSMSLLEAKLRGTPAEKALRELQEPHEKLHGLIGRFEVEVDLKDKNSIKRFIEESVLPTFEEVMKHLLDLKEACRRLR